MKDLGQACYAFLGHPGEAMDKARDIFNKPALYETVFQEDLAPSQLLLPYLVYQEADEITKNPPESKLQDTKDEALSRYLRFPILAVVGAMLSTLAGQDQGYLSSRHSDELIRNTKWLPEFAKIAFRALRPRLAAEARAKGTGARSIVRQNDWMAEALTTAANGIQERITLEKDIGATGEKAISSILPF